MKAKVIPLRAPPGDRLELSDEALVAACISRDPAALAALYRRHQASIHRFICRLVGSRSPEIEDLVQLVFIGAWQSAPRFRQQASVRAWLFGIASNVARKHHRGEQRRQNAFLRLAQRVVRTAPPPEDAVVRQQLMDRLAAGLQLLPHDLRVAYVLCEIEEVPGVEAARALGVRPGTMWRRLHDARRRLRTSIEGAQA